MAEPTDKAPALEPYAHPERLVTSSWLAEHLYDENLVVVEADEDLRLYETGHIPGAVTVNWHTELSNQVTRDFLSAEDFTRLCSDKGIGRNHTVIFYGDEQNWWAAYTLWLFSLFGHRDLRLLDGGRKKWVAEGRQLTRDLPDRRRTRYQEVERDDSEIRAFREDVVGHIKIGHPLVDVRTPKEYRGELLAPPQFTQEGAVRGGHIPGAWNIPWVRSTKADGTFKSIDQLRAIYTEEMGLLLDEEIIVYCRIGERASHTWFALHHLLGYPKARVYDGSWVEWGNTVRAPIVRGPRPGGYSG